MNIFFPITKKILDLYLLIKIIPGINLILVIDVRDNNFFSDFFRNDSIIDIKH